MYEPLTRSVCSQPVGLPMRCRQLGRRSVLPGATAWSTHLNGGTARHAPTASQVRSRGAEVGAVHRPQPGSDQVSPTAVSAGSVRGPQILAGPHCDRRAHQRGAIRLQMFIDIG
jgi:hypothetical protein